jgi:uncharacterized membrane protein YiaA
MANYQAPSAAFVAASWLSLFIGVLTFLIGLYNSKLPLANIGFFFTVLMYALFAAVSVQKSVRDSIEGVPVTTLYLNISWFSVILTILLLVIGLWNTDMDIASKGFYGMAFVLSMFSAIAVQKNVRDNNLASK